MTDKPEGHNPRHSSGEYSADSSPHKPRHEAAHQYREFEHERDTESLSADELIERFRYGLSGAVGAADVLSPAEAHRALELTDNLDSLGALPPEVAVELVTRVDELNRSAKAAGVDDYFPLLLRLKTNVYGTPAIEPIERYDQHADSPSDYDPLYHQSYIFPEPNSVGLSVLHHHAIDRRNGRIRLRLGEGNTWYAQINDQPPSPLRPDAEVTLGSGQYGLSDDPTVAAEHLTLKAIPGKGIEVTDHSDHGTHYFTREFPNPAEYPRYQKAVAQFSASARHGHTEKGVEAARRHVGRAYEQDGRAE